MGRNKSQPPWCHFALLMIPIFFDTWGEVYGFLCAKNVIIHWVVYVSNVIQDVHISVVAHHKLPKLFIKWKKDVHLWLKSWKFKLDQTFSKFKCDKHVELMVYNWLHFIVVGMMEV
jgi:hypothetical protein